MANPKALCHVPKLAVDEFVVLVAEYAVVRTKPNHIPVGILAD